MINFLTILEEFLNENAIVVKSNRLFLNDQDIGTFEYHFIDEQMLEIDKLYINSEHQRKGIGKAVVKWLFDQHPKLQTILVYPHPQSEGFWHKLASSVDSVGTVHILRKSFE